MNNQCVSMLLQNILLCILWLEVQCLPTKDIIVHRSTRSSAAHHPELGELIARSLNLLLMKTPEDLESSTEDRESESVSSRSHPLFVRNHPMQISRDNVPTIESGQPETSELTTRSVIVSTIPSTSRSHLRSLIDEMSVLIEINRPNTDITRVSVGVSPNHQSTYRYIRAGALQNSHPSGGQGWKFSPNPMRAPLICGSHGAVLGSLGEDVIVSGPWNIRVTSRTGEILHDSRCLPMTRNVPIMRGYKITLTKLQ